MWRRRAAGRVAHSDAKLPARKIFVHGDGVTGINSRGINLVMACRPDFIGQKAPVVPELAQHGTKFVNLGSVNAAVYAMAAAAIGQKLRNPSLIQLINRIGGGFLISAAAMTATLQKSAN